jgi:hypothetical protein
VEKSAVEIISCIEFFKNATRAAKVLDELAEKSW